MVMMVYRRGRDDGVLHRRCLKSMGMGVRVGLVKVLLGNEHRPGDVADKISAGGGSGRVEDRRRGLQTPGDGQGSADRWR